MIKEKEKENTKTETDFEKTEIIYDADIIVKRTIDDFHKIKERFDNCTDSTGPSVFFNTPVRKEFINLKNRGIKLRFITEITKDNVVSCKDLLKITDLRHLDGIKGNFGIADGKDYGGSASVKEGQPPIELIRSNVKTFVDQQQFFFETLWNKAVPAEQKIKEIEEGIEPVKTKVLQNPQEIFKALADFYKKSNIIKYCFPVEGINLINNDFSNLHQEILDKYKNGKHKGIKWITSINNKKDIELVKTFLDEGITIRHVKDLSSSNFALSDKIFLSTIEKIEEGKMVTNILVSNEILYINHYNTVFENLWKQGIDIIDRIKDIEKGNYTNVEIIPNQAESGKLFGELFKYAKNEILMILSSATAFLRIENENGFKGLEVLASKGMKVKVLIPLKNELLDEINQFIPKYQKIDFR